MKSPKSLFAAIAMSTICAGFAVQGAWTIQEPSDVYTAGYKESTRYMVICGQSYKFETWSSSYTTSDSGLISAFPDKFNGTSAWQFSYPIYVPGLNGYPHTGIGRGHNLGYYYIHFTKQDVYDVQYDFHPETGAVIILGSTYLYSSYWFDAKPVNSSNPCIAGE